MFISFKRFISVSFFFITIYHAYAIDPVNKTLVTFFKNCDCSYVTVKILNGIQTGQAQCNCPGHTVKSFHVACNSKNKNKIINVIDCANDAGPEVVSETIINEKKVIQPDVNKESDNAAHAK